MALINREYKDRLFGSEENRAWTLSLYNAINHSNYTDPEQIQITTIKEVLYMGMHNDVSFLISDQINLYEQQSTYNPNMPLRQLQYLGNLYEQYLKKNELNKYSYKIIPLPVPKLIVFYNGQDNKPDEMILKLSDAFPKGSDPDVDVRVRMININHGKNSILLGACKPLWKYTWLIDRIWQNRKTTAIEEAVNSAIRDMPSEYSIKPFLIIHQAEVLGMLLTEYNEVETMNLFKREWKEEGLKEGIEKGIDIGKRELMRSLVRDKTFTPVQAAQYLNISEQEFIQFMQKHK